MTDSNATELLEGLRNVGNLHEFAELFGFDWDDDSDWTWHDVSVKMADDIEQAATLGAVECENLGYPMDFTCSECGCEVSGGDELGHNSNMGEFNFCPNCGKAVKR